MTDEYRIQYYAGLKVYAPESFTRVIKTPDMKFDKTVDYFEGNLAMLLCDVVAFVLGSESFSPLFDEGQKGESSF